MLYIEGRQALRAVLVFGCLGVVMFQLNVSLSKDAAIWNTKRDSSLADAEHLLRSILTSSFNTTHNNKSRPSQSISLVKYHGQELSRNVTVFANNAASSPLDSKLASNGRSRTPPNCLCPHTCDLLSSPSTRKCWDRIVTLQREHPQLGEGPSCVQAVNEGVCGSECHPDTCSTNGTRRDASTTTNHLRTAALKLKQSTTKPPKKVGLDWSRIQDKELPEIPFRRHDSVVIATKVEGPDALSAAKQMFCLFHTAYNRHVQYNVVLFTTLPWSSAQVQELQAVMPSINLTVASEGPSLEDQLADMTFEERKYLHRRCRVPFNETLTWTHFCSEQPYGKAFSVQLSYAWQAEFRAHRVWNTPELAPYRYMLWFDTDALCTKSWTHDPIQVMIDNNLAVLFDNIPGDYADNLELKDKMRRAYNRTFCKLTLDRKSGVLTPHPCHNDFFRIQVIHGFFHITDLDFYRNANSSRFLDILVESRRFSREWDDQLAVTIPAAMDAPHRSWDMRTHGLNLSVFHNGLMDGKDKERPVEDDRFTVFWDDTVSRTWPIAREMCGPLVIHDG